MLALCGQAARHFLDLAPVELGLGFRLHLGLGLGLLLVRPDDQDLAAAKAGAGELGGEEIEVISSLESGYWGYWAVVENGIYYLDTTAKPGIVFLDVNTSHTTRVFDLENRPAREAPGLAVSPSKETILYTQLDALSRDIMLVENFR